MKVVVLLLVGAQDHGDHGDHQEHSPLLFQSDHPLLEHVLAHLLSEDVALSDPDILGWKLDSLPWKMHPQGNQTSAPLSSAYA